MFQKWLSRNLREIESAPLLWSKVRVLWLKFWFAERVANIKNMQKDKRPKKYIIYDYYM